jgi:methionyl aminopeptidase
MMSINDEHDIEGLKCIGAAVAAARDAMGASVVPGVTTAELDAIGKEHLDRYGARSAPQLGRERSSTRISLSCVS